MTTIGIDLVAMCVNDLVVQGAEPLFFLDYFATGKLDLERRRETVIDGIAEGCREAGCALIGGETAEMPGMYRDGDYDLAGFAVGAVERGALLPRRTSRRATCMLALASSGVHSNGFSLVRRIVERSGLRLERRRAVRAGQDARRGAADADPHLCEAAACAIRKTGAVKALAHITGGGLTDNIPRVLPDGLAAEIDLGSLRAAAGVRLAGSARAASIRTEMLRTFNCGIGMIVVAAPDVERVLRAARRRGETMIGALVARGGGDADPRQGQLARGAP